MTVANDKHRWKRKFPAGATCAVRPGIAMGALWLGAALAGCPGSLDRSRFLGDGGAEMQSDAAPEPSCPDVVTEILQNEEATGPKACAKGGCHGADAPQGGLDLASSGLVARLNGATSDSEACSGEVYLDPDSPEQSLLYTKLLADPPCGEPMPFGSREALSDEDRRCVREWIASAEEAPRDDAGMPDPEPPGSIWLEAEAMDLTSPMEEMADPDASGGSYIVTPTAPSVNDSPSTAHATTSFESRGGTFRVWGRVQAPSGGADSLWVRIDDQPWVQWNNIPQGEEWHWDDVHDEMDANVAEFELSEGEHRLDFAYRESDAALDKVLITDDETQMPTGLGE